MPIFVFGSNRLGQHGGAAALYALDHYGAEWGVGEGLRGNSYALPTKQDYYTSLTLPEIAAHVQTLFICAIHNHHLTFDVTQVGCGLAGFTADQIAPLFRSAPSNMNFPTPWHGILFEHLIPERISFDF